MWEIATQILTGLASASNLFLVACGLTLIFGVTRVVNFAHGSIYMLGAYAMVTFVTPMREHLGSTLGFWAAIAASAIFAAVVSAAIEVILLRRLYRSNHLFQLLATFGVVLIVQDLVILIWGAEDILGPRAPGLTGFVQLGEHRFPTYSVFMIAVGPMVFLALWLILHRTRWGTLIRAASQDKEMVGLLGARDSLLMTSVLALGGALAGLAGALQIPMQPANAFMDVSIITEAFVITVIGGMGSMTGAFLAAIMVGLIQALGIQLFPKSTLVLIFVVMAIVLIIRPWGLLGRPEVEVGGAIGEPPERILSPRMTRFALGALAIFLLFAPYFLSQYHVGLLIEVLLMSLFAFSLNFIMGNGGLVSFGHAAYFGLGAYGAALAVYHWRWPMEAALVLGPLAAAAGALIFGWFVLRLAGVYAAMLTLAIAQILWSLAFQWNEFSGGDNGINGVWPSAWAQSRVVFYYVVLALSVTAIGALWRATKAPLGYTLRAGRDSPRRCEAIGINLLMHRWAGFVLAGAAAGLSGALFAFSKGTVDTHVLSVSMTVDSLVMVLIGGVNAITGPLMGGTIYPLLKAYIMPLTDAWRMFLGAVILLTVLLFPQGLAGFLSRLSRHLNSSTNSAGVSLRVVGERG